MGLGSSSGSDRFHGGELDDHGVWPEGIVVDPLGEHDVEVQTVCFLRELWRWIRLGRIFKSFAVVPEHTDLSGFGGFERFEDKALPFAPRPLALVGEKCIDGVRLLRRTGEPNVIFSDDVPGADLVNRLAIDEEPEPEFSDDALLFEWDHAGWFGADIQQEIASLRAGFDEHVDQVGSRFVFLIGGLELPLCPKGEAGLPRAEQLLVGQLLFRSRDGTPRDQSIRLHVPCEVADPVCLAVDEKVVHCSVAAIEFLDLGEVVFHELRILGRENPGVAAGSVARDRDALFVQQPEVIRREVKSHAQPGGAEGIGIHLRDILLVGSVRDRKVRGFGGEHAEAAVVLVGQHGVFESAQFRQRGPIGRVVFGGVEGLRQFLEETAGVAFIRADQAVADHRADLGINRPVDEHAERLIAECFQFFGLVEDLSLCGGLVGSVLIGHGMSTRQGGRHANDKSGKEPCGHAAGSTMGR